MSNGRSERRIPNTVTVEVCVADDLTLKERTLTENVSAHGVRILTQQSMRPKQQAMIISLNDGVWSRAKVVYCQRAAVGKPLLTRRGSGFCEVGHEIRRGAGGQDQIRLTRG